MAIEKQRYDELKQILEERRREIMSDVQGRMLEARTGGPSSAGQGVLDETESAELDIEDEIDFILIQMKSETLTKINEALHRLEDGTYGYCECGREISEKRLRALPFAVRCKSCEDAREVKREREALLAQRRLGTLFI